MARYAVVIEWSGSNYGAYAPDLPGCIAVGDTVEEVRRLFGEALELHLEAMARDGDPIPEPTTLVEYVEVDVSVPTVKAS